MHLGTFTLNPEKFGPVVTIFLLMAPFLETNFYQYLKVFFKNFQIWPGCSSSVLLYATFCAQIQYIMNLDAFMYPSIFYIYLVIIFINGYFHKFFFGNNSSI